MSHPYGTFSFPEDEQRCADMQLVLNAAIGLRRLFGNLQHDERLRREAIMHLDRAVMVAMGCFHVHPGQRRKEHGGGDDGPTP